MALRFRANSPLDISNYKGLQPADPHNCRRSVSISGLSILTALALAVWEWFFFFYAEDLESTFGLLSPNRLGLDLAWIAFVYLSVQLVSIPFASAATRDRFIGVLDGMASLVPLGISLGGDGRDG